MSRADTTNTVPLTGIVVCFNEGFRLTDCLSHLSFCDELIVVDLGSTDDSRHVAKMYNARIIDHEWTPVVESVREIAIKQAKTDWLIFLDPDMVFPQPVLDEVYRVVSEHEQLGWIRIPYVNYFRQKELKFSRWMRRGMYPAVMHKERVVITPNVHAGMKLKEGFIQHEIKTDSHEDCIIHYWGESYRHILSKHIRYLKQEGASLYNRGKRFSWGEMLADLCVELRSAVLKYRGLSGGVNAWGLTLFWLWYVVMRWRSLYKHERKLKFQ